MSIEAGRAYFRQFGMEDRVQEFTVSSATVDLAAKALGVEGDPLRFVYEFYGKPGTRQGKSAVRQTHWSV